MLFKNISICEEVEWVNLLCRFSVHAGEAFAGKYWLVNSHCDKESLVTSFVPTVSSKQHVQKT